MTRTILQPDPHHPISIEDGARVRVELDGEVIAEKAEAILLSEASYPTVAYIDPAAFDADRLVVSDRRTWCPYKGEADYFGWTSAEGEVIADVIWRYVEPHAAVSVIAGHLAFYTDRATVRVL